MNIENNENEQNIEQEQNNNKKIVGLKPNLRARYLLIYLILSIIIFLSFMKNFSINSNYLNQKLNFANLNIITKQVGNLNISRYELNAINLSNDKVLIFGGNKIEKIRNSITKDKVIPPYKYKNPQYAEIFDAKQNKFTKISKLVHSEYYGHYIYPNGNILLISKEKPCQIYNSKTKKFETAFMGIKTLPSFKEFLGYKNPLYIIKKSNNKILLIPKCMGQITELDTETGSYKLIYNDENKKFLSVIPISNENILCIGLQNKDVSEQCLNKSKLNETSIDSCKEIVLSVYIFNINEQKYTKIGNINKINSVFFNILKLTETRFLLYTETIAIIFDLNNYSLEEKFITNIKTYKNIVPVKFSDEYTLLSSSKILNNKTLEILDNKNILDFYLYNPSIIQISKNKILLMGGQIGIYNPITINKAYIIELEKR